MPDNYKLLKEAAETEGEIKAMFAKVYVALTDSDIDAALSHVGDIQNSVSRFEEMLEEYDA